MTITTHIYEHAGVMLNVQYTPGDPPTFQDIRVLDRNYRPTGPDLQPLLHSAFFLESAKDENEQPCMDAQTILSAIVADLP